MLQLLAHTARVQDESRVSMRSTSSLWLLQLTVHGLLRYNLGPGEELSPNSVTHLPNSPYSQSRVLLPGAASVQQSQTAGGWRTPACQASGAAESGNVASPDGQEDRLGTGTRSLCPMLSSFQAPCSFTFSNFQSPPTQPLHLL